MNKERLIFFKPCKLKYTSDNFKYDCQRNGYIFLVYHFGGDMYKQLKKQKKKCSSEYIFFRSEFVFINKRNYKKIFKYSREMTASYKWKDKDFEEFNN